MTRRMRLAPRRAVSRSREIAREFGRDVRYSVRIYCRRPLVTALALTALTLAIGATTGVFSVVNALLLRPLPFRAGDRLVQFQSYQPRNVESSGAFAQWRAESTYLEDAVIYNTADLTLNREPAAVRVQVAETTPNFFAMIGAQPALGRGFAAEEGVPGRNAVAVIADTLWREAFAADSHVVGTTIRLNGMQMVVVGVAPRGFDYPGKTAVWTPTQFDYERLPKSGMFVFHTIGRLKPGLSLVVAQQRFEAEIAQKAPDQLKQQSSNYGYARPRLVPMREQLAGPAREASLVLLGAVGFVLLVACANVANLLLTRITERRRELAMRAALGASRARLLRQLVTESLVLTGVASACGVLVAVWASRLATAAQPPELAAQRYTVLDSAVVGFAVAIAVAIGLVFGVLPALITAGLQPSADVVRLHAGADRPRAGRLRQALIALQVALTLTLLAGSFVMGRAFVTLLHADLGFRTEGLATLAVELNGTRYANREGGAQYLAEALTRLRASPDVVSAAAVDTLPLAVKGLGGTSYSVEAGHEVRLAMVSGASEDYFRTLGGHIVAGREFAFSDGRASEPVAIVNEQFARTSGYGLAIIGKRITPAWGGKPRTVVGIVGPFAYAPGPFLPFEQVFVPLEQSLNGAIMFVARVRGEAASHLAACRDAVRGADRQVPVFDAMTLEDRLADQLAAPRFYTTVVGFFAMFTLLLALVGIYGVATYSIEQRTHEIGVRLALGSTAAGLRRLMLWQGLPTVGVGALLGSVGVVALRRLLEHFVAGAGHVDARTVVAAGALLISVASGAIWSATRRITRLQAMEILRAE